MLGVDTRPWGARLDSMPGRSGYWTYFGLGHSIQLMDEPGVFRVSPAGLSLGSLLVREFGGSERDVRALELGTGSGVLALLLRNLGFADITATDIAGRAVDLAGRNEEVNFSDRRISFVEGDLFGPLRDGDAFDLAVFNPPGWRTPSSRLLARLRDEVPDGGLDLAAMFHGDSVVVEFLSGLPRYLAAGGRAIIGLNSMIGIQDVLARYHRSTDSPLRFRLLERHTIPMLFYTDEWRRYETVMVEEFTRWRQEFGSAFSRGEDGTLYWSYEIIECSVPRDGT